MPQRTSLPPMDYDTLAEFLRALSYPARLELLDALRFPKTVGEIRVAARRGQAGEHTARAAARATVAGHLEILAEAGLVRAEEVVEEGHRTTHYVVNPQKLYGLIEELRRLSTLHATHAAGADATGTLGSAPAAPTVKGPRLVLVHGVYEGKAFALRPELASEGRWIIGRRKDLAVTLDYDPYVSFENSAISQRGGRFSVADLEGSKNGTFVNWVPVAKGGTRPLENGDILGVGRSLLSFRSD